MRFRRISNIAYFYNIKLIYNMGMKIEITGEFIKIGQLLKKINIISSGGAAKYYLEHNEIKINGKKPEGRNTKVPAGATVWINDDLFQIVQKVND